jgi:hypothetical protein
MEVNVEITYHFDIIQDRTAKPEGVMKRLTYKTLGRMARLVTSIDECRLLCGKLDLMVDQMTALTPHQTLRFLAVLSEVKVSKPAIKSGDRLEMTAAIAALADKIIATGGLKPEQVFKFLAKKKKQEEMDNDFLRRQFSGRFRRKPVADARP